MTTRTRLQMGWMCFGCVVMGYQLANLFAIRAHPKREEQAQVLLTQAYGDNVPDQVVDAQANMAVFRATLSRHSPNAQGAGIGELAAGMAAELDLRKMAEARKQ